VVSTLLCEEFKLIITQANPGLVQYLNFGTRARLQELRGLANSSPPFIHSNSRLLHFQMERTTYTPILHIIIISCTNSNTRLQARKSTYGKIVLSCYHPLPLSVTSLNEVSPPPPYKSNLPCSPLPDLTSDLSQTRT